MKRLTKKDYNICNVCDRGPLGMNWNCDGFPACGEKAAYDRLAAIEDILGDDYELDRLREIAEAERDGRCVVLPCKFGDTVYSIRHERVPDDDYRMSFHIEMRIVSQKFGLIHADCIGKSVFLTRAEAEEALKAREQDD